MWIKCNIVINLRKGKTNWKSSFIFLIFQKLTVTPYVIAGEAGDWKNWLKVAQSEAVDAEIEATNIPLEIQYT